MEAPSQENTSDQIVAMKPSPRIWGGWIALVMIFGLLIPVAFVTAMRPSKSKSYFKDVEEFKQVMRVHAASAADTAWRGPLKEIERKVVADRFKSPTAAKLYAETRYEQGEKILPADLKILRESGISSNKAYAEIYGSQKLTQTDAARLGKAVVSDSGDFLEEVAKVHALDKAGIKNARDALRSSSMMLEEVGTFIGLLIGACGVVCWVVYAIGRTQGRFTPVGHPARNVTLIEADILAVRAAMMMAAFILIGLIAYSFGLSEAASDLLSGVSMLVALAGILVLPIGDRPTPLSAIGLSLRGWKKNMAWGVLAWVASIPVFIISAAVSSVYQNLLPDAVHPIAVTLSSTHNAFVIFAAFFGGSILAPIFEETMFRGAFCGALNKVFGVGGAIVVSSLSFAMLHPQGPAAWLTLASIGAMGCLVDYQRGSIVPSITLHFVHNTALLIFTLLIA